MSSIAAEETVVYGDGSMKGTEYKSHIQNSLCACKYVYIRSIGCVTNKNI